MRKDSTKHGSLIRLCKTIFLPATTFCMGIFVTLLYVKEIRHIEVKQPARTVLEAPPIPSNESFVVETTKSPLANDVLRRTLSVNSSTRESFCAMRERKPVQHDRTRYEAEADEMRKRLSSKWKKFPTSCSAEFSSAQQTYFQKRMLRGQIPTEAPIGCQGYESILDLYHVLSPSPEKVFIEIGPNKGYDLISFYERWTNFTTNLVWMTTGMPPGCPWFADIDRHVFPRVIAVEPARTTFDLLTELVDSLPVCNIELLQRAMSNATGRAIFRELRKAADEASHLRRPGEKFVEGEREFEVDVDSVDSLLGRLGLDHVDFLAIDAEGSDALIMDGAEATLRAGRVDMLSFEYLTSWGRTLGDQVRRLSALGYDSYYLGRRAVIKLSGDGCWADAYNADPDFGNVLSVRTAFALGHDLLAPFNIANAPNEFTSVPAAF